MAVRPMLNKVQAAAGHGAPAARKPLLTIGMPVYNGSQWLRPALDSLLAQTFTDFVLVVCDNASTDDTAAIVQAAARRDARVQYHRNPENIGVYRNYNKAFSFADTKYFKWASANDLCAPEFLEECVNILESDHDAVLAYPATTLFYSEIEDGELYERDPAICDERPSQRFKRALSEIRLNNAFNGVIRTDTLRRTLLNQVHAGSDVALIAELAISGTIRRSERYLFYRRMDPSASSSAKTVRDAERFFSAEGRDIHRTPTWDFYRTCVKVALRGPHSMSDRIRCLAFVLQRCLWSRRKLWRDIVGAASG